MDGLIEEQQNHNFQTYIRFVLKTWTPTKLLDPLKTIGDPQEHAKAPCSLPQQICTRERTITQEPPKSIRCWTSYALKNKQLNWQESLTPYYRCKN